MSAFDDNWGRGRGSGHGQTEVQIPTAEELARHLPDHQAPSAVAALVSIVIDAFKFRQIPLDDLVTAATV